MEVMSEPKKRGRKRSKKNMYFTEDTQQAIIEFNNSDNQAERNRIYKDRIDYAFNKLAENIIHTFKFYYFDVPYIDVRNEVVAFLNEKIHKFNGDKGKAFSYFSIVAKNYLIIKNNANYARMKQRQDISVIDENRDVLHEVAYSDYQEQLKDFMDQFIEFYDNNLTNIFTNKKDIIIGDTLLELFRIRHNIENFNKKALYILIRERTGLKTQNITRVVNVIKKDFFRMFRHYQATGHVRHKV